MLPADKDPPTRKSAAKAEGGDDEDDWGDDADDCGVDEDDLFDFGVHDEFEGEGEGEGEAARGSGGWVTAEDDSFLHAHDVDEEHTIRQSSVRERTT